MLGFYLTSNGDEVDFPPLRPPLTDPPPTKPRKSETSGSGDDSDLAAERTKRPHRWMWVFAKCALGRHPSAPDS